MWWVHIYTHVRMYPYAHVRMHTYVERDVAQVVEHSAVKVWILLHGGSILHGGCIYSLSYFPFQPVVPNWFIKGCGMWCPVCGKVHIEYPLLLIGMSSLCGNGGFSLKKYVTMTICLMWDSNPQLCPYRVSILPAAQPRFPDSINLPLSVCEWGSLLSKIKCAVYFPTGVVSLSNGFLLGSRVLVSRVGDPGFEPMVKSIQWPIKFILVTSLPGARYY